jgi:PAS domain S-box-containing protein
MMQRPDPSGVALASIAALMDGTGSTLGAVAPSRDIAEHARLPAILPGNEWNSRQLLVALPVAVYMTDAAGRITFYNQAAVDLWGRRPELGTDEWCGSWRLYWPDGRPMPHGECPMALALKEQRPIRGAEAIAERPDGTRVPFLAYPTPLFDEATGELVGAINSLVDISEHKRGAEAGQRLASIVESSDDAIVSKDLDGIITSWNRGAERLFGYAPAEAIGKPIMILLPADRHDEEPAILDRIRRGDRVDHYETVRRRKDGSLVEISLMVSPVRNAEGRIIGASKIARDITERRRAEERQNLLLREMNHRVKNLLALASSVVTLSARSSPTTKDMAAVVRERLGALSRAHDLTLPDFKDGPRADKAATLHALVRTIGAPYDDPAGEGDPRIVLAGPDVPISGNAVTSFALLLHEFATNAAKYGALSSPTGRVEVQCTVENGELFLTWKEHGGPPLNGRAESEGFGSLLARGTVEGQFSGRIVRDWQPEGLAIHLSVPCERLTA